MMNESKLVTDTQLMLRLVILFFTFPLCVSLVARRENTIPERHFVVSCNTEKKNIKLLDLGLCFWKASAGGLLHRLN